MPLTLPEGERKTKKTKPKKVAGKVGVQGVIDDYFQLVTKKFSSALHAAKDFFLFYIRW